MGEAVRSDGGGSADDALSVGAGGTLPKYVRVSEMLIREIAAGHLVDGARLPSERDMAADLGISVGTLRKALADLAARGLLERRQGSGNYIRQRAEVDSVYAFFRLERLHGGGLPSARVLSVDLRARPDVPGFGSGGRAWRIRRLRRIDDDPVAVEEIWLDGACAVRLSAADLSESLYLFYRHRLDLVIARAEDRVGVDRLPDWAPAPFLPGHSAGHVERLGWRGGGAGPAVEYSRTWFDHDKARYVSRMGKG